MLDVLRRPRICFRRRRMESDGIDALHHRAHRDCFIANPVKIGAAVGNTVWKTENLLLPRPVGPFSLSFELPPNGPGEWDWGGYSDVSIIVTK